MFAIMIIMFISSVTILSFGEVKRTVNDAKAAQNATESAEVIPEHTETPISTEPIESENEWIDTKEFSTKDFENVVAVTSTRSDTDEIFYLDDSESVERLIKYLSSISYEEKIFSAWVMDKSDYFYRCNFDVKETDYTLSCYILSDYTLYVEKTQISNMENQKVMSAYAVSEDEIDIVKLDRLLGF